MTEGSYQAGILAGLDMAQKITAEIQSEYNNSQICNGINTDAEQSAMEVVAQRIVQVANDLRTGKATS